MQQATSPKQKVAGVPSPASAPGSPDDGDVGRRRRNVLGRSINRWSQWRRNNEPAKGVRDEARLNRHALPEDTDHTPVAQDGWLMRKLPHRQRATSETPMVPAKRSHDQLQRLNRSPANFPPRRAISERRRPLVQSSRTASPSRAQSASFNATASRQDRADSKTQFTPNKRNGSQHSDSQGHSQRQSPLVSRASTPKNSNRARPSSTGPSVYLDREQLAQELDLRWMLNLSMQFRDGTKREKLFITYAEYPNFWRRMTLLWDYMDLVPGSMEADLLSMPLQSDKNLRIYESVCDSLTDINFFDTVTALRLKTEDDGRLHIYVSEDLDEVIEYPAIDIVAHCQCPRYRETDMVINSHLSGFVYKVKLGSTMLVRKEIPGPDCIDAFLYELNAMNDLQHSRSIIRLMGIVTDEDGISVKALLIAFAPGGSLGELIYNHRHSTRLSWGRRQTWAYQIVSGLCDVHEAGYVQGDMTLSNIVVDGRGDAQIIDLNRRGCPVGWEPPELMKLIRNRQRVSLMISVKTDVYQLGMLLYALAEHHDEPDKIPKPIRLDFEDEDVPEWYKDLVTLCLSENPRDRPSAKDLLHVFEKNIPPSERPSSMVRLDSSLHPSHCTADHEPFRTQYYSSGISEASDSRGRPRRRDHRGRQTAHKTGQSPSMDDDDDEEFVTPAQEHDEYHVHRSAPLVSELRPWPGAFDRASWASHRSLDEAPDARHPPPAYQDPGLEHALPAPPHQDSRFDETVITGLDDDERFLLGTANAGGGEVDEGQERVDSAAVAARANCIL